MARRGGARPGAGRPPKSVRFRTKIASADKIFADGLKDAARTLLALAEGGRIITERKYQPAGLVTLKIDTVKDNGDVVEGLQRLAFPELDPFEMVCVEEKRAEAMPDRAALIYICNRILGRPFAEPVPVEESDEASYSEAPISEDEPDIEPRPEASGHDEG